jgi:hemoglobin-like flavoprotein
MLFDQSYTRLFGDDVTLHEAAHAFFECFYHHFLQHPEVDELFRKTDMPHQVSMLHKSFFQLSAFYITNAPSAELERLAAIHYRLGISDAHYDRWLDALVEAVKEKDSECDLATELAWRWAMAPGLTYMKLFAHLSTIQQSE